MVGYNMAVEKGDKVEVDYTGRLKDGTIFDTSVESVAKKAGVHDKRRNYCPLSFTVGDGTLIAGFDEGVRGMEPGQKKTVEIPPEDAYGTKGSHPLAGKTLIFDLELRNLNKK